MERENGIFHRIDGSWYLEGSEKGPLVLTREVNGVVVNKPRNKWTKDDKENVQRNLR